MFNTETYGSWFFSTVLYSRLTMLLLFSGIFVSLWRSKNITDIMSVHYFNCYPDPGDEVKGLKSQWINGNGADFFPNPKFMMQIHSTELKLKPIHNVVNVYTYFCGYSFKYTLHFSHLVYIIHLWRVVEWQKTFIEHLVCARHILIFTAYWELSVTISILQIRKSSLERKRIQGS